MQISTRSPENTIFKDLSLVLKLFW